MLLDILIIFIIPLLLLFVVLGFITLNRYITYKERVAMMRSGFPPEAMQRDAQQRQGNRGVLWGGVITAMSGLALLLSLSTLGMGVWLIAGLLPLFVGVGIVLIYYTTSGAGPTPQKQAPETNGEEEALRDAGAVHDADLWESDEE
ncbi:MAG: DUF6249 domain-containing protein [Chloroflexota bacterium]|nr:DUF6249 domain-containing protein [Chloroflexota bacterium]